MHNHKMYKIAGKLCENWVYTHVQITMLKVLILHHLASLMHARELCNKAWGHVMHEGIIVYAHYTS